MIKIKYVIFFLFTFFLNLNLYATNNITKLSDIFVDLENSQAIKRGARVYFDYCQGCHSLKYMRYTDLANGIRITSKDDKSISELIREYFLHSTNAFNEYSPILSSITKENGVKWFGKVPPDLSLVARYRSPSWIYTYMQAFYKDDSRPWGVNNVVFPDVGMPHALLKLQGVQILRENINDVEDATDALRLIENGDFSSEQYYFLVRDLVTFLSYIAEPTQVERQNLGFFVILYFIGLSIILYLLKKVYWVNIK